MPAVVLNGETDKATRFEVGGIGLAVRELERLHCDPQRPALRHGANALAQSSSNTTGSGSGPRSRGGSFGQVDLDVVFRSEAVGKLILEPGENRADAIDPGFQKVIPGITEQPATDGRRLIGRAASMGDCLFPFRRIEALFQPGNVSDGSVRLRLNSWAIPVVRFPISSARSTSRDWRCSLASSVRSSKRQMNPKGFPLASLTRKTETRAAPSSGCRRAHSWKVNSFSPGRRLVPPFQESPGIRELPGHPLDDLLGIQECQVILREPAKLGKPRIPPDDGLIHARQQKETITAPRPTARTCMALSAPGLLIAQSFLQTFALPLSLNENPSSFFARALRRRFEAVIDSGPASFKRTAKSFRSKQLTALVAAARGVSSHRIVCHPASDATATTPSPAKKRMVPALACNLAASTCGSRTMTRHGLARFSPMVRTGMAENHFRRQGITKATPDPRGIAMRQDLFAVIDKRDALPLDAVDRPGERFPVDVELRNLGRRARRKHRQRGQQRNLRVPAFRLPDHRLENRPGPSAPKSRHRDARSVLPGWTKPRRWRDAR